jgi:hypothetical protein
MEWWPLQRRKMTEGASLQDQALLVLPFLGEKSSTCSSLEDLANASVCLGRAFEVFIRADLFADFFALFMEKGQSKARSARGDCRLVPKHLRMNEGLINVPEPV